MKRIILYVYQSIDGCPVPADKVFDSAVDASSCLLIDEETYLRIYSNHFGWPITGKRTFVVTKGGMCIVENGETPLVTGDALGKLREMVATGEGEIIVYGEEIGRFLLDNDLVDEMIVTTLPKLVGGGEKALSCGLNRGKSWSVKSEVPEGGKIRTVFSK